MDNNKIKVIHSSSLPTLLAVAFIVLKLCNVITWSWTWVLAPIWIPFAICLIIIIILWTWAGIGRLR